MWSPRLQRPTAYNAVATLRPELLLIILFSLPLLLWIERASPLQLVSTRIGKRC